MPFAEVQVGYAYVRSVWLRIKAIPAVLFGTIFIGTTFAARLLVAVMNIAEVRATNDTTQREISLKDSSIVLNNSVVLPLTMKNELLIFLP